MTPWRITCDGYDLYVPEVDELQIFEPELKCEDNKAAQFTFKIFPNNRNYSMIHKLASTIEVRYGEELYFRGRPLNDTVDFYNAKKIVCESELAFLNDCPQRPYTFPLVEGRASPADFLEFLIGSYNASMPAGKSFTLGEVTVTDPNDYIRRSDTEYSTTWQLIDEGLLKILGGHIFVRYADGVRYLDYLAEVPDMSTQPIIFGENLLDIMTERRGEEIATAIMPIGAVDEETGERLTIYSVEDTTTDDVCKQGDIVYSKVAEIQYGGRIIKAVKWDDVTTPAALLNKARLKLYDMRRIVQSATISAADMSAAGHNVSPFIVGRNVYVDSEPHAQSHQLQSYYYVAAVKLSLFSPEKNSVTVGATVTTMTESNASAQASMAQQIKTADLISRIEVIKTFDTTLSGIRSSITANEEAIQQNYQYMQDVSAQVADIMAYIRTGHVADDAQGRPVFGVLIGQNDAINAFKSIFTAQAVEFYEGDDLTAFLSNKKLNVQTVRANNLELSDDLADPLRTDWQITSDSRGFNIKYIGG